MKIGILKPVPRTCGDGPGQTLILKPELVCSPHLRGWSPATVGGTGGAELFPAPAGMVPIRTTRTGTPVSVPRTCGDGPKWHFINSFNNCCSPHLRGWSQRYDTLNRYYDLFPAPAGMVPSECFISFRPTTVPRTCGDGPSPTGSMSSVRRCSPHLRGWSRSMTCATPR